MYTRSYNIQSRREVPCEPAKEESKLNEKEGYNGTVMLREQEEQAELPEQAPEANAENPTECRKPFRYSFSRVPKFNATPPEQNEKTAPRLEVRSEEENICDDPKACEESNRKEERLLPERQKPCQKQRRPDLDRLLIGAIMLLLMNEKADDVLTLIFGYILM